MDLSIHIYKWRLRKMRKWKEISKLEKLKIVQRLFCIIVGSLLLAFGTRIFLVKLNIISGGLSGIAIVIQRAIGPTPEITDIIVTAATWVLWIVGLIFGGKAFAFRTLLASIFYPIFYTMFTRIPAFEVLGDAFVTAMETETVGVLLLGGIFGGVFVGAGVALSFLGDGSSGGIDIIIYLLEKYTKIKHSVLSFVIDGSIILLGLIIPAKTGAGAEADFIRNLILILVGIISCFVTAVTIEFVYGGNKTSFQVDVISDEWQKISEFAQDKLGRGATIIHARGGFKGDERVILRIVFPKYQYRKLRDYISTVDSKAFVTFTQTNAVYGEGFTTNEHQTFSLTKKDKKHD